jgi:hypothetical protein
VPRSARRKNPHDRPPDRKRLELLRERVAAENALAERCAWCLGPMPAGEFEMLYARLNEPPRDLRSHFVYPFLVGDRTVHAWPLDEDAPEVQEGFNISFALCSHGCLDALSERIHSQARGTQDEQWGPALVPERDPSPEERALAVEILENLCSWCGRSIPPGDPVTALFGKFKDPRAAVHETAGEEMTILTIAGRPVPAFVAAPGSRLALEVITSPSCSGASDPWRLSKRPSSKTSGCR